MKELNLFCIWFNFIILYLTASAHTVETTIDEYPGVSGITTARDAMRNLSEEDKDKIAAQVEYLVAVFRIFPFLD